MLVLAVLTASVVQPALPSADLRVMLRDGRTLVQRYGDRLWPGFSLAPFRVDLVQPDREYLFCSDPVVTFAPLAIDPITGCRVQVRQRQLPADIEGRADLPGPPIIGLATPNTSGKSRTDWVITLAHEYFHQYQSTIPGYKAAVDRLGQALGQGRPGWALDYIFPYAAPAVSAALAAVDADAEAFLLAGSADARREAVAGYVASRRALFARLTLDDRRYFEFQIGQEGVARWTEMKLAEAAGATDAAMAAAAKDRRAGLLVGLRAIDRQGLNTWRRSAFYTLGAIEAEMLEALHQPWRSIYRSAPFSIGGQLDRAVERTVKPPPP